VGTNGWLRLTIAVSIYHRGPKCQPWCRLLLQLLLQLLVWAAISSHWVYTQNKWLQSTFAPSRVVVLFALLLIESLNCGRAGPAGHRRPRRGDPGVRKEQRFQGLDQHDQQVGSLLGAGPGSRAPAGLQDRDRLWRGRELPT